MKRAKFVAAVVLFVLPILAPAEATAQEFETGAVSLKFTVLDVQYF